MSLILIPVLIILLLAFSAFLSMASTAFLTVSRPRILVLAQEGDWRAKSVGYILHRQDKLLSALSLLVKIINISVIVMTTDFCVGLWGGHGLWIAASIMIVTMLIVADVLPKFYALHHAEEIALATGPFIRLILLLVWPVMGVVTWAIRRLLAFCGADYERTKYNTILEDIRSIIDMHLDEQGLDGEDDDTSRHERAMMRSILDLTNVTVSEVMIHRRNVDMLDADLSAQEVIDRALASPYSRIPIYQDNPENIVGVIHGKLLTRQLRAMDGQRDDIDILSLVSEPWFIPETTTLFDQLQSFRERREHFAFVVDEYGAWLGIVTLEDILEEIVGQIDDEHDQVNHTVQHDSLGQGGYVVDGTMTIRDLNREFDWYLPNDDYATVAGLILYESQIVPDIGQSFVFYNYRFDVLERQRHQITKVRITPLDQDEDE